LSGGTQPGGAGAHGAGHPLHASHVAPQAAPTRALLALTAAAILLRLVLFLGRGHYVAFDEGWYLLLGRNFWSGEGYTLSGLQHVALSPLFPVLAGALDVLIGDAVWAGRIVAAASAGLLVVPCWFIFHRLAGRTTAVVACTFLALMPSLAPFVAPYWIGWDLWVGAEPLLHLFLFTGVAFFLRAWEGEHGSRPAAAGCGAAFGLAYLARPEAIVAFGFLGLVAVLAARRRLRSRAVPIVLCAAAFAVTAAPYWSYLHDTLGRWSVTGRGIQVMPASRVGAGASGGASNTIEAMLWRDESTYVRTLYSLNAAGTALANGYWGVRRSAGEAGEERGGTAAADTPTIGGAPHAEIPGVDPPPSEPPATDSAAHTPGTTDPSTPRAGPNDPAAAGDGLVESVARYVRSLGVVIPWYVWLFVAVGVATPWLAGTRDTREYTPPGEARRPDLEALVAAPIVGTSVLIAIVVATDPRTQLFVAPLACFYAARGALAMSRALDRKMGAEVRPLFATALVAGALALVLLATHARRLYFSLAVGSPHHIVAAENAVVGAALGEATPPDATVMSWHPAIALFADRDWRVLPLEPMQRIVRYARTEPRPYLVFSVFYPPELLQAEEPHYLVVHVPADTPTSERWRIEVPQGREIVAFGRLHAVP